MAGQVRVNGELVLKASALVEDTARIEVDQGPRFVSRGGEKLVVALQSFAVDPEGLVCADVGASTGGFTDCLLQHGARRVYAIDVGKGILHWKLRSDPRVLVMEETNARYLAQLPEPVDLATVDASFISLKILLPVMQRWFFLPISSSPQTGSGKGDLIALVKPQFEVGRKQAARGDGVIRDPLLHQEVLRDILSYSQHLGCQVRGLIRSPILGPKGNTEFLAWLQVAAETGQAPNELAMESYISELFEAPDDVG
jgi:23S rRNA (cytidine1920-2'-O)/16S rRNA (cytidine1409-2'-O)-methyltransferase